MGTSDQPPDHGYCAFTRSPKPQTIASVDSEAKRNGFMKTVLDVFAKLFEHRLEWRLETKAFSRREISGEDDVLIFFGSSTFQVDWNKSPRGAAIM